MNTSTALSTAKFGHSLALALAAARVNVRCIFTRRRTSLGTILVLAIQNKENGKEFASFMINAATTKMTAELFCACVIFAGEAMESIMDKEFLMDISFELGPDIESFDPLASAWVKEYEDSMRANAEEI